MKKFFVECCVESLDQAIKAEKKGADQIELCKNLKDDGLTPDIDIVSKALNKVSVPIKIMVRPRKGNFIYSESEIIQIKNQIMNLKVLGVEEIVFGALNQNNNVDFEQIKRVADWSYPMKITFHKAIDYSSNFFDDIKSLIKIDRVKSILTSGKSSSAKIGASTIKKTVKNYQSSINVIAAGKITNKNLDSIHKLINGRYYHGKNILGKLS